MQLARCHSGRQRGRRRDGRGAAPGDVACDGVSGRHGPCKAHRRVKLQRVNTPVCAAELRRPSSVEPACPTHPLHPLSDLLHITFVPSQIPIPAVSRWSATPEAAPVLAGAITQRPAHIRKDTAGRRAGSAAVFAPHYLSRNGATSSPALLEELIACSPCQLYICQRYVCPRSLLRVGRRCNRTSRTIDCMLPAAISGRWRCTRTWRSQAYARFAGRTPSRSPRTRL
jgi:hypothetical protein